MERELFEGECEGGPLDGKTAASRFPKGFLLVDKADDKAWVYEWDDDGEVFVARADKGEPVDYDRRLLAAESADWDVVAFAKGDNK